MYKDAEYFIIKHRLWLFDNESNNGWVEGLSALQKYGVSPVLLVPIEKISVAPSQVIVSTTPTRLCWWEHRYVYRISYLQ